MASFLQVSLHKQLNDQVDAIKVGSDPVSINKMCTKCACYLLIVAKLRIGNCAANQVRTERDGRIALSGCREKQT